MDNEDFWTLVVAAVVVFLVSLPALLDSFSGIFDNFGGFRWLLIVGPLAMIALALYGRWAGSRTSKESEAR